MSAIFSLKLPILTDHRPDSTSQSFRTGHFVDLHPSQRLAYRRPHSNGSNSGRGAPAGPYSLLSNNDLFERELAAMIEPLQINDSTALEVDSMDICISSEARSTENEVILTPRILAQRSLLSRIGLLHSPVASHHRPSPPDFASFSFGGVKWKVKCAALTEKGVQCSRNVSVPQNGSSYDYIDSELAVSSARLYCKQHAKAINARSGYYAGKYENIWVDFRDWVSTDLQWQTQSSLRSEMEKKPSTKDRPGHIYVFEIRGMWFTPPKLIWNPVTYRQKSQETGT